MASTSRGYVEKRGPGRWRARYRGPDGRERSKTFERRLEAHAWLTSVTAAKQDGTWRDPGRGAVLLRDWAPVWLASRSDLRPTSRQRLEQVMRAHVVPRFGARGLAGINNGECRVWVAELSGSGLSAATTRKALFALRACLAAAVADRRIAMNPALDVPLPAERAAEQRFLSREDVDALLDAVPDRYRVVVVLGALCGLRWGEIVGLRRSRIDTLRRRISVLETVSEVGGEFVHGEPKTAKSRRVIPVGRAVMAELERHLSQFVEPDADALIVTTSNGRTPGRSAFGSATWRPACRRAGLDGLRVHDLRHSYVSLLLAAGADVQEVSKWAGHASITTTLNVYAHLINDRGDDISDRMDALLTGSRAPVDNVRAIGF